MLERTAVQSALGPICPLDWNFLKTKFIWESVRSAGVWTWDLSFSRWARYSCAIGPSLLTNRPFNWVGDSFHIVLFSSQITIDFWKQLQDYRLSYTKTWPWFSFPSTSLFPSNSLISYYYSYALISIPFILNYPN